MESNMGASKSYAKFKENEKLIFLRDGFKDDLYVKTSSKIHKNKAYWSGQAALRKYEA